MRAGFPIPRGELVRKAMHMSPGLLVFAMRLIPHYDPLEWYEVGIIAGVVALITWAYIVMQRTVQRDGEHDFLTTVLSYGICVVAMSALFRDKLEFTCVVVAILAWGDGAAFFAGKLFGRRKLPWNRSKSWIGTFAFVIVSAPLGALAFWLEAQPDVPFALAAWCALAAAVVGAIAESLPMKITDNLRVGIGAGVGCVAAYFALAPHFGVFGSQ